MHKEEKQQFRAHCKIMDHQLLTVSTSELSMWTVLKDYGDRKAPILKEHPQILHILLEFFQKLYLKKISIIL